MFIMLIKYKDHRMNMFTNSSKERRIYGRLYSSSSIRELRVVIREREGVKSHDSIQHMHASSNWANEIFIWVLTRLHFDIYIFDIRSSFTFSFLAFLRALFNSRSASLLFSSSSSLSLSLSALSLSLCLRFRDFFFFDLLQVECVRFVRLIYGRLAGESMYDCICTYVFS